jgi:hypothetical protein
MFRLLLITGLVMMMETSAAADSAGTRMLTDFTADTEDFGWYVVNDNVMGGRSQGNFTIRDGRLTFTGRTNTRGGGFSSLRTAGPGADLTSYDGIRLRIRGDGRRYIWQLTTKAEFRGRPVRFWAGFDTVADTWTTVDVPFSDFVPRFRGTNLDDIPLDVSRVTGMGLMIYDGRDGPFAIEVDSVESYLNDGAED